LVLGNARIIPGVQVNAIHRTHFYTIRVHLVRTQWSYDPGHVGSFFLIARNNPSVRDNG
jgi:hypothetical protein